MLNSLQTDHYARLKHIVLCGSMAHYEAMLTYQGILTQFKIPAIIPVSEGDEVEQLSKSAYSSFKRRVSWEHLKLIRSQKTFGILVTNEAKNGISNYIGANTFAEVAVAFTARKRIFLINDFYEPYSDELLAWGAIPLYGNLDCLVQRYWNNETSMQLEFHLD